MMDAIHARRKDLVMYPSKEEAALMIAVSRSYLGVDVKANVGYWRIVDVSVKASNQTRTRFDADVERMRKIRDQKLAGSTDTLNRKDIRTLAVYDTYLQKFDRILRGDSHEFQDAADVLAS